MTAPESGRFIAGPGAVALCVLYRCKGGMNRRSIAFVAVLAAVGICVLLLVAAVPMQSEVPLNISQNIPAQPWLQQSPLPPAGRLLVPPAVSPSGRGLGLRPFGVDRAGLAGVWWHLGTLAALFVLAAVVLLLLPRRVDVLAEVLSDDWGQRFLAGVIGLLGYLGAGLLAFILFINVVGAPLGAILVLSVYLSTGIGLAAVSLALGRAICHRLRLGQHGPVFHLGMGMFVLYVLTVIPYVGWIVAGIAALLGFGAFLWTRGGDTARWSLDDLVE
jgi:hypothetical protein